MIYEDVKKALQDVLAPDLHEIRGEIRAISIRLDSIEKLAEARHTAIMRELAIDKRITDLTRRLDEKETGEAKAS